MRARVTSRRAHGKRRVVRWLGAAAALIFCLTSGYVAGQRVMVAAAPLSVETVMTIDAVPAAPAPTRVISLQPGVNWTDSKEGR